MNNNNQDPNKKTEEELKKLIEELKRKNNKRRAFINFGFMLHRDYLVHLVLSLAVNTLILAVVMGLSIGIGDPLVEMKDIASFLLAAIVFTLIENLIKILVFRYAFRAILYSMGLLSITITYLVFYAVDLIMQDGFVFDNAISLLLFTIGFTFFRIILSTYLRRWIYTKNLSIIGGKK